MATRKTSGGASSRLPNISMETIGAFTVRVGHWPARRKTSKRPLLFFNGIGANMELAFALGDWIRDREISLLTCQASARARRPASRIVRG